MEVTKWRILRICKYFLLFFKFIFIVDIFFFNNYRLAVLGSAFKCQICSDPPHIREMVETIFTCSGGHVLCGYCHMGVLALQKRVQRNRGITQPRCILCGQPMTMNNALQELAFNLNIVVWYKYILFLDNVFFFNKLLIMINIYIYS